MDDRHRLERLNADQERKIQELENELDAIAVLSEAAVRELAADNDRLRTAIAAHRAAHGNGDSADYALWAMVTRLHSAGSPSSPSRTADAVSRLRVMHNALLGLSGDEGDYSLTVAGEPIARLSDLGIVLRELDRLYAGEER